MVNESEEMCMKMIKAIIRSERFELVKKALEDKGLTSMTVSEVQGRGEQKGITLNIGEEHGRRGLLPKIRIEIIIRDSAAKNGRYGDDKIFYSSGRSRYPNPDRLD